MVKGYHIKSLKAYKPIWPPHLADAPSFKPPKPRALEPFFKDKRHTIPLIKATYAPHDGDHNAGAATNESASKNVTEITEILQTTQGGEAAAAGESSEQVQIPSSYPFLRRYIQQIWHCGRHMRTIKPAYLFLKHQYLLLSDLTSSKSDSISSLKASEQLLQDHYTTFDLTLAETSSKPIPRPRLTGSYILPTAFNPPLPRLRPQPPGISGMIRSRIRVRERRLRDSINLQTWTNDMKYEAKFLEGLGIRGDEVSGWEREYKEMRGYIDAAFEREKERSNMVFEEEVVRKVEKVRAEKRERMRVWKEKDNERKRHAKEERERLRKEAGNKAKQEEAEGEESQEGMSGTEKKKVDGM